MVEKELRTSSYIYEMMGTDEFFKIYNDRSGVDRAPPSDCYGKHFSFPFRVMGIGCGLACFPLDLP